MRYLYHASTNKNLELIKPQITYSNKKYIGDYVFATNDKKLATMYLVNKGIPTLMNIKSDKSRIIICEEANEYFKSDLGGAIYKVQKTI